MKKGIIALLILFAGLTKIADAQVGVVSPLNKVVVGYLDLKKAFVKNDATVIKKAADDLVKSIGLVPEDKLAADQVLVWKQFGEKLEHDAEYIGKSTSIVKQRLHFSKLSNNVHELLKTPNITDMKLYYQHCPDANNGKGAYWISDKLSGGNPYFGKDQQSCGETEEVFK